MQLISKRSRARISGRPLAAIVSLAVALSGCSQAHHFYAASLPIELQAAAVENVQTLDLSHLAGPTPSIDMIDCGDVLEISLAAGLDAADVTRFFARVGDDGSAVLPEIGPLHLANLDMRQAEHQIAASCIQKDLYRQPYVTVAMARQRVNRVTVVGAVNQVGVYELPRGASYLLAAIVSAGGLGDNAGTNVEIRNPPEPGTFTASGAEPPGASGIQLTSNTVDVSSGAGQVVCLNLAEAVQRPGNSIYLRDGAVVTVERREPEPVQVLGLVSKPGQYDYPLNHDLRMFGAIAEAGGLSNAMADKVYVLRDMPDGQGMARIQVSLNAAKSNPAENLRLAPGDIVSVERTPATVIVNVLTRVVRFTVGASAGSYFF